MDKFVKPRLISAEEAWKEITSVLPVHSARMDLQICNMTFDNALYIISEIRRLEGTIENLKRELEEKENESIGGI